MTYTFSSMAPSDIERRLGGSVFRAKVEGQWYSAVFYDLFSNAKQLRDGSGYFDTEYSKMHLSILSEEEVVTDFFDVEEVDASCPDLGYICVDGQVLFLARFPDRHGSDGLPLRSTRVLYNQRNDQSLDMHSLRQRLTIHEACYAQRKREYHGWRVLSTSACISPTGTLFGPQWLEVGAVVLTGKTGVVTTKHPSLAQALLAGD